MLVIRLRRIGKKNKPSYRIVVAEHTMAVSGKFVEDLGFYNPHSKAVGIKKDEAIDWMKKGAKPSNTVAKILKRESVKHNSVVVVKKNKKSKKKIEEAPKVASATPAAAEAVNEEKGAAETPEQSEAAEAVAQEEPPVEEPAA